jgi:hypothetical protein
MDLADLDLTAAADKGAALTLRHPVTDEDLTADDGTPMTITLLGSDSGKFKRAFGDLRKKAQGRKGAASDAEIERNTVNILVSVTTGWSGIVWEGKPLGFSEENAKMLFTARPWIRDQMDAFMADRSNFFGKA